MTRLDTDKMDGTVIGVLEQCRETQFTTSKENVVLGCVRTPRERWRNLERVGAQDPEVEGLGVPAENFQHGAYGFVGDSDQKVSRSEG